MLLVSRSAKICMTKGFERGEVVAKGMILAAGQGTRVRPLTKQVPKPMVPILGKPVMEYLIEHMANFGVREIMINVAFNHYKIENYFGDGRRCRITSYNVCYTKLLRRRSKSVRRQQA